MTDPIATIGHNSEPAGVNTAILSKLAKSAASIGAKLANNSKLAGAAKATRHSWLEYGRILAEARETLSSNNAFNAWLKENDLERYASRNVRTDAMWLYNAEFSDTFMDEVFPSDMHAPKTLRTWFRKEADAVLDALVGNPDDDGAVAALSPSHRAFFDEVPAALWDTAVSAYKTRTPRKVFADLADAEAVADLIKRVEAHVDPVALAGALKDALIAKIADPAWLTDPDPVDPDPVDPA